MAAGVKGTKGVVRNLSFPPEVWARIERVAAAQYSSPTGHIVRFIIANIDVLDPPEDSSGD